MYTKGTLLKIIPTCDYYKEHQTCNCENPHTDEVMTDTRSEYNHKYVPVPVGDIVLPHSCDYWVIGGKEQVEAMIADLQEALKAFG